MTAKEIMRSKIVIRKASDLKPGDYIHATLVAPGGLIVEVNPRPMAITPELEIYLEGRVTPLLCDGIDNFNITPAFKEVQRDENRK
jgi:hypothetical protein